jgi:hypothetical protein
VKIKPILARLQNAIGSQDTIEQMVLLPEPATQSVIGKSKKSVNLVVGYNNSLRSQTALDIALLIAHQTRLATQKQVKIHVVYVLGQTQSSQLSSIYNSTGLAFNQLEFPVAGAVQSSTNVLTPLRTETLAACPALTPLDLLEQADRILWQARCLAEEWNGTFIAHLRFGCLDTELRQVVESEAADLLLLGCDSADHPVVQQLGANFPCSVLGIPTLVVSG